jgi:hypothetical protein
MASVDRVVENIQREVGVLFKNSPVSERNAGKHLAAAWQLEQAAKAIRERVARRSKAATIRQEIKKATG